MRHLLETYDLTVEETQNLILLAMKIKKNPIAYTKACEGKILATLFFEPSTRTRLSFESAMHRLGGAVIGFSSASSSSAAKGESVADTIAMISSYADIVTMRHPIEGAALAGKRTAKIPLINAGDGGHQHPTQTLTDLVTIHCEKGRLGNLTVGLCGDLLYGRTVHSLVKAMMRYEAVNFVFISPKELVIPNYLRQMLQERNIEFVETTDLDTAMPQLDILYMTRVQRERFASEAEYERLKDSYVLDTKKMETAKADMIVLHPLPRVNEIAIEVDEDSSALYFEQAKYGVYARMALILMLLGKEEGLEAEEPIKRFEIVDKTCKNTKCITNIEKGNRMLSKKEEHMRCAYCDMSL